MSKDKDIKAVEMDFEGKNILLYHMCGMTPLSPPEQPLQHVARGVATAEKWWALSVIGTSKSTTHNKELSDRSTSCMINQQNNSVGFDTNHFQLSFQDSDSIVTATTNMNDKSNNDTVTLENDMMGSPSDRVSRQRNERFLRKMQHIERNLASRVPPPNNNDNKICEDIKQDCSNIDYLTDCLFFLSPTE